jgi:hypothetical protein
MAFALWKGVKRTVCGNDIDCVENIELEGDVIGACLEESDAHGTQTVFYRTAGGRVVVHRVHWSRENETMVANVFVFRSLEEASTMFWLELEQAGLISPRSKGGSQCG